MRHTKTEWSPNIRWGDEAKIIFQGWDDFILRKD